MATRHDTNTMSRPAVAEHYRRTAQRDLGEDRHLTDKTDEAAVQQDQRIPSGASSMAQGLDDSDIAILIKSRCDDALAYAASKGPKWQRRASWTKLSSLALSAAATITLGFAPLTPWTAVGFVCSALVTTLGAVEPYFNHRSRWVGAEKAIYEWHRVKEDLELYVATTAALDRNDLLVFDRRRADIWITFSEQWLSARRSGGADAG